MTYTDKVKKSEVIKKAILSLNDDEGLDVIYRGQEYTIQCHTYKNGNVTYSIWNSVNGMNIESLGRTIAKAYTYDMMSQRTTYNFPLYKMSIVEDNPLKKLEGYMGTEAGK